MSVNQAFASIGLGVGMLLAAEAASAQESGHIRIEVMISHISDRAGSVDQRALELHRKLQQEFSYQSLRVLQTLQLALVNDEVGSLRLPNGRHFRLRPMYHGDAGWLVAVQLEDGFDGDMRLRNHRLVVIGAQRFEDGRLVISLKPVF